MPAGETALEVARESVRAGLFPRLGQPRTLGRYRLVRRIGDGGMGLILEAYDPQLDRVLAIKIVRAQTDESSTEQQHLLAEARTAARLSHPNVVTVYDVGLHQGRVFVAMELVRGPSLRRWIAQEHSVQEVLQVMLQAGRGLAAAHAAGLVHRDFKPGNVLVGDDGRVRVVDFGLARRSSTPSDETACSGQGAPAVLTATGVLAGTPAYMAPEQWIGGTTDARTDQFSFCMCLYEALFGARPFGGRTLDEMRDAVLSGPVSMPTTGDVPPLLRNALERGLARRKEERFEDMDALLDVLASCGRSHLAPTAEVEDIGLPGLVTQDRARAYVAGLPRGLDSHGDCLVDVGLVRLALSRAPIEHDFLARLERVSSGATRWIPEVLARAIMAAICDAHFRDLDTYAAFVRQLIRARMTSVFVAFLLPRAISPRAAEAMPRVWRAMHTGTALEVETMGSGVATVKLPHPPGLLDELGCVEVEQTVHIAMERAGASLVETHVVQRTTAAVRLRVRWG
jgi:serine/threonine protein kinase